MTRVVILGDIITDTLVRPQGPIAADSDTLATIETRPGGSGANLATWLAVARGDVHLIAAIGDDAAGRERLAELRADGVIPHVRRVEHAPTGTIVVLIESPTCRSMLTDPGANRHLTPDDIPAALFAGDTWFHHSGYCLLYRPEALDRAVGLARRADLPVSVDPSSAAFLRAMGPGAFVARTRGADLLFPNWEEGRVLTGLDEPIAIARALAEVYGAVALKLGAEGAVFARGDEVIALSAAPSEVLDPTGAGDAFAAGFLHSHLEGHGPRDALRAGIRLAGRAVASVGARPHDKGAPRRGAPG